MHPAPSLTNLRQILQRKQTPIIGILFAPPYTEVGAEKMIPRLGYLNDRTAEHIHFFCAGYGGYAFANDAEPIGEVRYKDGTVIPWGFSQSKFAEFVNDMEGTTSWKYSGESDLILIGPELEFTNAIVFDINAMISDGAIDNSARLFEAVIALARSLSSKPCVDGTGDKAGLKTFGPAVVEVITEYLPEPLRMCWKRGQHYRVRDLTRDAEQTRNSEAMLFLSYRRADSQEVVGRIYDRLKLLFADERIFRDLDSIPFGKPFPHIIREAIDKSAVALVVIGPTWATIADGSGNKRLDDSADFVRMEIEFALSAGILVVPVLVSRAIMPRAEQLPASLQPLVHLQAVQVRPDPDFHRDMDYLIDRLSNILE